MDDETKNMIDELIVRIGSLESELDSLKDEVGNHRHDGDRKYSHNY